MTSFRGFGVRTVAITSIVLILLSVFTWWFVQTQDPARHAGDLARRLARVTTVEGRLSITLQGVTLEQELWVERPYMLRTETESGPSAFAGTIVVLNQEEGWVYSRALNMATVVARSAGDSAISAQTGNGSLLERMPDSIIAALLSGEPYHRAGQEQVAGRSATRYELLIPADDPAFPAGVLTVWLDDQYAYPLAWSDSQGRELRFSQIAFNRPIDPATFIFFPPPGAAVQRITVSP